MRWRSSGDDPIDGGGQRLPRLGGNVLGGDGPDELWVASGTATSPTRVQATI